MFSIPEQLESRLSGKHGREDFALVPFEGFNCSRTRLVYRVMLALVSVYQGREHIQLVAPSGVPEGDPQSCSSHLIAWA